MSFTAVLGVAVLASLAAFSLREMGWRAVPLFSLLAVLLLLSEAWGAVRTLAPTLSPLFEHEAVRESAALCVRLVGVGYLTSLTADACRDLGEGGIARAVEGVGRIELLVLVVPTLVRLVELGTSWLT